MTEKTCFKCGIMKPLDEFYTHAMVNYRRLQATVIHSLDLSAHTHQASGGRIMAIEWGPHTKAAAERQAEAIRAAATESRHHKLADRAASGEFTDYADTHACPITELHRLCRQYGLHALADRVANGDFDATIEESDEWAKSDSAQAIARELPPEMRDVLKMNLNN